MRRGSFNIEFSELLPVLSGNGAITGRFAFSDQVFYKPDPVCGIFWPVHSFNNQTPGGSTNAHGGLGASPSGTVPGFITLTDVNGLVFLKSIPATYFTLNSGWLLFEPRRLDYTRCFLEYPAGSVEDVNVALNEYLTFITEVDG